MRLRDWKAGRTFRAAVAGLFFLQFVVTVWFCVDRHRLGRAEDAVREGQDDMARRVRATAETTRAWRSANGIEVTAKVRAFGEILAGDPGLLVRSNGMSNVRALLDVDKVYVSDGRGVVRWCDPAVFLGFDYRDRPETHPYLPALTNLDYTLLHYGYEFTTREASLYAIAARQDRPGIVETSQPSVLLDALADCGAVSQTNRFDCVGYSVVESARPGESVSPGVRAEVRSGRRCLTASRLVDGRLVTVVVPDGTFFPKGAGFGWALAAVDATVFLLVLLLFAGDAVRHRMRYLTVAVTLALIAVTVLCFVRLQDREEDLREIRHDAEFEAMRGLDNAENLQRIADMSKSSCCVLARAVARIVKDRPSLLESEVAMDRLRRILSLDEIDVCDARGVVVRSTERKRIGTGLGSEDRTRAFLPALTNQTFELAQDLMPREAGGTPFQSAGVARQDEPGIVLVGRRDLLTDVRELMKGVDVPETDEARHASAIWEAALAVMIGVDALLSVMVMLLIFPGLRRSVRLFFGTLLDMFLAKEIVGKIDWILLWKQSGLLLLALLVLMFPLVWIGTWSAAAVRAQEALWQTAIDFDAYANDQVVGGAFSWSTWIASSYDRPRNVPQQVLSRIVESGECGCVDVVDRYGEVVVSSDPARKGMFLRNVPQYAPFARLLANRRWLVLPDPEAASDGKSKRLCVGVAFPKGRGYVRMSVGEDVVANDVRSDPLWRCQSWRFCESGFALAVDRTTGAILANSDPDAGSEGTFADFGGDLDRLRRLKPRDIFDETLNGQPCRCVVIESSDRVVIAALPKAKIADWQWSVLIRAVGVLSVFFFVIAVFGSRLTELVTILKQHIAAERRRQELDLTVARTIQESALPANLVDDANCRLFALMNPAEAVGGDFYDFYELPDGRQFFMIADVSGDGVPAAMFMMRVKATICRVVNDTYSLAEAAVAINEFLCRRNGKKMFVTAWLGAYDRRTGRIDYVNAGHNPPLVKRADGKVQWLRTRPSLVFGIRSGVKYRQDETCLAPGDSLLLYTDGVTEALSSDGAFFGEERLERAVASSVGRIDIDAVRRAVADFSAGAAQSDDITLLALVVKPTEPVRFPVTAEGLAAATAHVDSELIRLKCPHGDYERFLVSIDEVLSNIRSYSGSHELSVAVWRVMDDVGVEIGDSGVAFDVVSHCINPLTKTVKELKCGGMGLFMVGKLMDRVDYRRTFGRNIVTLTRHVGSRG